MEWSYGLRDARTHYSVTQYLQSFCERLMVTVLRACVTRDKVAVVIPSEVENSSDLIGSDWGLKNSMSAASERLVDLAREIRFDICPRILVKPAGGCSMR